MTHQTALDMAHHGTIPAEEAWAKAESARAIAEMRKQIAVMHIAHDFGSEARDHLVGKYGDALLSRVLQQRNNLDAAGRLNRIDEHGHEQLIGKLNLTALLKGLASEADLGDELRRFSPVPAHAHGGGEARDAAASLMLGDDGYGVNHPGPKSAAVADGKGNGFAGRFVGK